MNEAKAISEFYALARNRFFVRTESPRFSCHVSKGCNPPSSVLMRLRA